MRVSRTSTFGRGHVIALLTLLVYFLSSVTVFAQWTVTGHEPKEPPYTTIRETNTRGETRETIYTREKDGRVSRMVQHTKDKQGRPLSNINEWYDDHGNLIGGARQQFSYDPPFRQDLHYVPSKGKEKGGWVDTTVKSSATGLITTELATAYGNIKVNLPDDLAAGDTISGTVILDPIGKNQKEQAKNQNELNGYVVEVEDQKTKSGQKWGKWLIPATVTAIALVVRDRRGREVARDCVPVETGPFHIGTDHPNEIGNNARPIETGGIVRPELAKAKPTDYHLPRIGQVGKPAIIRGPFGGDSMATSVKIGGQNVDILAESPRQVVAANPTEVFGPMQIEVRENDVVARGNYRNISVQLAVGKDVLLNGEQTPLTMTLRGFQGIEKPVSLRLSNHSPETISMAGGDVQEIEVKPEMVGAEGTYVKTFSLTGLRPGSFSLGVALADNIAATINNTGENVGNNTGGEFEDGLGGSGPITGGDRKKLIDDWHRAWEAKRIAETTRRAAEAAQKAADAAKKAAEDAKRIVEREPNAPDIDKLKREAEEKKRAAETAQKEADGAKGSAEAAQKTADAAQGDLDKSKLSPQERAELYGQEAAKLDEEAKAAQESANRVKGEIKEGGDRDNKLQPYADEKQREANEKRQQADDLKKAAKAAGTNLGSP